MCESPLRLPRFELSSEVVGWIQYHQSNAQMAEVSKWWNIEKRKFCAFRMRSDEESGLRDLLEEKRRRYGSIVATTTVCCYRTPALDVHCRADL